MSKIKLLLVILLICISACGHFFYLKKVTLFSPFLYSKKLTITAQVKKVLKNDQTYKSFIVRTERICNQTTCQKLNKKIRLNLYYSNVAIKQGQKWQFKVRLKPWHGYANPGVYNSELWAFVHGVVATGYVINHSSPILVSDTTPDSLAWIHDALSQKIEKLAPANLNTQAVLKALILGDKSDMSPKLQQLLQQTGTSHLLAISGLHIGLMAMFAYFICFFGWRVSSRLCLMISAHQAALLFSALTALFYALLTGFATPAMRAFCMVLFFVLAQLYYKKHHVWQVFILSLLICIIAQPFALLTISFWLSYFAVFMILYLTCFRFENKKFFSYWKIQVGITVGMMPILFFYFQKTSVVGLIANAFAIPLVSFLILPMAFLASIFPSAFISGLIFKVTGDLIQLLIYLLTYVATLPGSVYHFAIDSVWLLIITMVGTLFLFAPRQLSMIVPGFFFLLPVIYYKPIRLTVPSYQVEVLDVGQGLSIVVNTAHHVLVYDLGPIFPNGNSATKAVVIPYLRSQRIKQINKLMISHQDSDHVGDLLLLVQSLKVDSIFTSAVKKLKAYHVTACQAGQSWLWDGVNFQILAPLEPPNIGSNEQSCVLKINNGEHSVLLTGDIDKKTEQQLVQKAGALLNADILIAAHHGSNSSSSMAFIKAVSPKYVVVSQGFLNRYHFPSSKVVQRFKMNNLDLLETSHCGAITFRMQSKKSAEMSCYRYNKPKFWYYDS